MPGVSGGSAFATDTAGNFWLFDGVNLRKYEPTSNEWHFARS
jgi:hypothetical protein